MIYLISFRKTRNRKHEYLRAYQLDSKGLLVDITEAFASANGFTFIHDHGTFRSPILSEDTWWERYEQDVQIVDYAPKA